MFTLLAGSPPFWAPQTDVDASNDQWKGTLPLFSSPEWDDRSATVKDLITRLLEMSPRKASYGRPGAPASVLPESPERAGLDCHTILPFSDGSLGSFGVCANTDEMAASPARYK
ncbi:unnamed protein product [Staurois parvus]|uniref:Protein kinase domain-containing protein n=1 Tax=Staurois parvus TaxID=386267 RepID=A0ABN9A8Y0_9NEOB|nr:unnamed protein product [Staurois parvus]